MATNPETITATITALMFLAIKTALPFRGSTSPNPPVGAVLFDSQGRVLSTGAHERAGGPHAEVVAIQNAERQGVL